MKNTILLNLILLLSISSGVLAQNKDSKVISDYNRKKTIIDFPAEATWYNHGKIKSLFDTKNKVVVLNFWDRASVSARSSIGILQKVSKEHNEVELFTIDVPKSPQEKEKGNVAETILQYGIDHSFVQVDGINSIPNLKSINTFPTALVIVEDVVVGRFVGIDQYLEIDSFMSNKVAELSEKISFSKAHKPKELIEKKHPKSIFNGPSAIISDGRSLLFFADSGNDRVVCVNQDGEVQHVIGSGFEGSDDGSFSAARFNNPKGLAYDSKNQILYVADCDNHSIRRLDFKTKSVVTVLGSGEKALQLNREVAGTSGRISYPTDLELRDGRLFITMSGFNQIWVLDLTTNIATPLAGNGRNQSLDGESDKASLADPRSVAFDNTGKLLFLDVSSKSIRQWSVENKIITLRKPYPKSKEKLLYPSSINVRGKEILVVDPYQNNIYTLKDSVLTPILQNKLSGYKDGKLANASLNNPYDVAFLDGLYYITDQGNNLIRTLDLRKGKVSTFEFTELGSLTRYEQPIVAGDRIFLDPIIIGDGLNTINLEVDLGNDYEVLEDGRNEAYTEDSKGNNRMLNDDISNLKAKFECLGVENNRLLRIEVYLTYRSIDKPEKLFYKSIFLVIPLEFEDGANTKHEAIYNLSEGFEVD